MTNLGYDQAMQLRATLVPIAYLLCTTGLLLAVFRHWGNFHEILMSIVGIAVIVILINGYPTVLTTVADAFKQLREQTTAGVPGSTPGQGWTSVFEIKFEQPAWDQIAEKIEITLCQMFKWIGTIGIWILDWIQAWAFNGLIAISPVLLGMLAVPWTQGTGITFLLTSFGVAAWHLGIALVDILLASIATQIFAAAGVGGGVAAGTVISIGLLPIFLGALAAIVLVSITLYLAVPFVIASVLRGASPLTAAATGGMQMTLTAFGLATMAGSRIAARGIAASKAAPPLQQNQQEAANTGENKATSPATQPMVTPSGSSRSTATVSRGASVPAATEEASPEERQSRILAGYQKEKSRAPRPRRKARNLPDDRDESDESST